MQESDNFKPNTSIKEKYSRSSKLLRLILYYKVLQKEYQVLYLPGILL